MVFAYTNKLAHVVTQSFADYATKNVTQTHTLCPTPCKGPDQLLNSSLIYINHDFEIGL